MFIPTYVYQYIKNEWNMMDFLNYSFNIFFWVIFANFIEIHGFTTVTQDLSK